MNGNEDGTRLASTSTKITPRNCITLRGEKTKILRRIIMLKLTREGVCSIPIVVHCVNPLNNNPGLPHPAPTSIVTLSLELKQSSSANAFVTRKRSRILVSPWWPFAAPSDAEEAWPPIVLSP